MSEDSWRACRSAGGIVGTGSSCWRTGWSHTVPSTGLTGPGNVDPREGGEQERKEEGKERGVWRIVFGVHSPIRYYCSQSGNIAVVVWLMILMTQNA